MKDSAGKTGPYRREAVRGRRERTLNERMTGSLVEDLGVERSEISEPKQRTVCREVERGTEFSWKRVTTANWFKELVRVSSSE